MMRTTATIKGQIVIPAAVRALLGIKAGTRIQVEPDVANQRIILRPVTRQAVERLTGRFRGHGLIKALQAEKKREREL